MSKFLGAWFGGLVALLSAELIALGLWHKAPGFFVAGVMLAAFLFGAVIGKHIVS